MYETCEENENPEDVFSSALGTLYGYTPVTLSSAGATLVYTHRKGISHFKSESNDTRQIFEKDQSTDAEPLKIIIQTPDTHARNWALHASSVWMAALFLADHIDNIGLNKILKRRESCQNQQDRMQLLELGAGAGLPGLVTAKTLTKLSSQKLPWNVTLSDFPDEALISTLRENVRRNELDADMCRVVPYAWGEDVRPLLSGNLNEGGSPGYDIVIAADTLWNPQSHATFLSTLVRILRKSEEARIHLVAGFHTGRYTIAGFLDAVSSQLELRRVEELPGLEIEDVQEHPVLSNDSPRPWSPDRIESEEENRKWVVWIVLKWS